MQDLQFGAWVDDFLAGLWVTVYVTVLAAVAAVVVAFVLGIAVRTRHIVPRTIARIIIELFRGTSLLVQLFWFFYVLPEFGFRFDPLAVAVFAFGLNFGAYGAEVVRGAINAVPTAQWEGSIALNLTPAQRMRRVILPQSIPLMIPPFNNLLIQLLKSTPLIFLIFLNDLTFYSDQYRNSVGNENFIFPLLLVIYFVLSYTFTLFMHVLEARANTRLGRPVERRRIFKYRGPQEEEAVKV
ncbi:MAG: ectoine/hydroxyectoine ABC transporter permease subunit EhuC [Propionibacteriales bacterium]|nr:ectoine/hydroxyectoine ABC transporter permease subunit EhuC [Propionibacteriales bacterium]